MYSERPLEFVIKNELVPEPWAARRRRWRSKLGDAIAALVEPALKMRENKRLHLVQTSRALENGARLSPQQFSELQDYQETAMDLEARKKYFHNSDHSKTMHGIAPPMIETILRSDPSVRSVLDIGCNYAYMDYLMAKRFPGLNFYGIDAPHDLEKVNDDLKLPNLTIHSGYALETIENGVRADLCYFSSTAATIRTPELKAYLKLMSTFAKYVVFSEPIYQSPDGASENPDKMDPDASLPVFLQVHFASNKRGYLCYAHNYKEIVERSGFSVLHYRVLIPAAAGMHWVQLIGKNNNL